MGEAKKFKLNIHVLRRILIGIFCAAIGACVFTVLLKKYDPTKNTIEALSSVCMDVICIVILFILVCSFAFDRYRSNRATRMFVRLLIGTIWALFLDFLNWSYDGSLEHGNLTFLFTVGSLCMGSLLACILCQYLYRYMEENHGLSGMRKSANTCSVLNLLSFALTFSLALSGTAFSYVNGHYEVGALYDIVTVIPIATLLYMTAYIFSCVSEVGWHDVLSVIGYIFIMIAGALIEAGNGIGTTYVAISIADIFIFVMLQNEVIAQEKRNVQEWMRRSNTDELTGVFNRLAFEEEMRNLENVMLDENFVYVSADVNSLKNINDSHGHDAGDELLVGAAGCLKTCFDSYGKIFRTGGDEFIAMLNVDPDKLHTIQANLEKQTNAWRGKHVTGLTISCGYVSKKEAGMMSIRQMANLADRRMYEAKDEYYRRTGIERRKINH